MIFSAPTFLVAFLLSHCHFISNWVLYVILDLFKMKNLFKNGKTLNADTRILTLGRTDSKSWKIH